MNLKKKFVVGAASVALIASMGGVAAPAAFATPSLPGSLTLLDRLAGADRVATSLEVAKHEWAGRPDNGRGVKAERVYIASGDDSHLVDMAGAGMLVDGPIVFVTNNVYVGTAVGQALEKFGGLKEVVPIGGTTAIADSVAKAVSDEITGAKVGTRLAGEDRYATSAAIANYIYQASLDSENDWYGPVAGGNFTCLNFANGADAHLVDAMVAGTLDNCPTVLSKPDGSIPESVAEVIKKTLPLQFNALGGTAAVPDSTIQDAWIIKTLGNKWETSYEIPNIVKTLNGLNWLVDGCGDGTILPSDNACNGFMGLIKMVKFADQQATSWEQEVKSLKNDIANIFKDASWKLPAPAVQAQIRPILENIYGKAVMDQFAMAPTADMTFVKQNKGTETYAGVDYDAIEATTVYKRVAKAAKDDLETLWRGLKQDADMGTGEGLTDRVAQLSQLNPAAGAVAQTSLADVANPSLAAVAAMARYTHATDKKWLDSSKAQQAELLGKLRVERDKIAIKSEWRLGGADRFETAQLIANAWAAGGYGSYVDHQYREVYIANGHRLADNLAAGQLTQGPILLVRGNETKAADLPEFTQKVAKNLQCWNRARNALSAYGVGGTAVLADSALGAVVNQVNTSSLCPGGNPDPNSAVRPASKLTATVVTPGEATPVDGVAHVFWDGAIVPAISKAKTPNVATDAEIVSVTGDNVKVNNTDTIIDAITVTNPNVITLGVAAGATANKVNLLDGTKPGSVTVKVSYRGQETEVTIPVYIGASAAWAVAAAADAHGTIAGLAANPMTYMVKIATPASTAAISQLTNVRVTEATYNGADAIPLADVKVQVVPGDAAGDPAVLKVTLPKGTYTNGATLKVSGTLTEPNKTPKDTEVTLPAPVA